MGPRGPKRTFTRRAGQKRGRPSKGELSDQSVATFDLEEVSGSDDRERCECDFWTFLRRVMRYPDLDAHLHGSMARFISSDAPGNVWFDKLFLTRESMVANERGTFAAPRAPEPSKERPYGADLDGRFRGCLIARRSSGKKKLVLIPRGHLKSSVITVAYSIWRIIRDPAIRILVANATAMNAFKFLRAIRWQFMNNPVIERLWPVLHVTTDKILAMNLTWSKSEFTVPRTVEYEAGESTVEGIGVGGNLVSRHYDLIIADDLVNNKNVKTPYLIEQTFDWWQNMHALLEPGGEVIVVGTRWDYNDLYSTLIYSPEYSREFGLFLATALDGDKKPLFPRKFSAGTLDGIRSDLKSEYKWSCQYMNQPVDQETAELKASWLKFSDRPVGAWEGINHYTFVAVDLAFTEEDGDATAVVVVKVDALDDWYVTEATEVRRGDIPGLVDAIFDVVARHDDLMTLGIETRGFQRAVAHGLYDEMEKRGKYFSVRELKSESNKAKKLRILRLAPRFRAGKIYMQGRGIGSLEGGMKTLAAQYVRFPRGHDDLLDALAYICDIAVKPESPEPLKERPAGETHKERLRRLSRELNKACRERAGVTAAGSGGRAGFGGRSLVDTHLGSEF